VFDFRTAIVHLKSTDTSVADKGNKWRVTAAKALAAWITADQSMAGERDYLVMGDMNAETAQQGLGPLSKDHRLLTVGMQTRYGKEEALTRVASKRLLDHIVITSDAVAHMPAEDIEEQLIIRTDTQIANWTSDFSDHVPVAVRFVLGKDAD
jgi:endonuclease/exonuclease/phosphatase family metal-dependent hydrolase